jgi:hypothetical protein
MTTREIVAASQINCHTVAHNLKVMHRDMEVHIQDWVSPGSGEKPRALWALGDDEDAIRPNQLVPVDRAVVKSLRNWNRSAFGPFATAMWNVTQGERG